MRNSFLDFFKIRTETFQKKIKIEIWTFLSQICFRNQFLTLESGQTENKQIRVFAYFQFQHLTKSQLILKANLKYECPYFYSEFFFKGVLAHILKVKNGFPIKIKIKIVISKWPKTFGPYFIGKSLCTTITSPPPPGAGCSSRGSSSNSRTMIFFSTNG